MGAKSVGRPSLYPQGTETTVLKVPKKLKEQLQKIGIALAWGDKEKALEILDQDCCYAEVKHHFYHAKKA
jgi:hypothetical protein